MGSIMALYVAAFFAFLVIGCINALTFDPTWDGNVFESGSGANVATMTGAGVSWNLDVGATTATVTVTIPSNRWFGVGFGVGTGMVGAHAIIFNSASLTAGTIEERDFSGKNGGSVSSTTWAVDSFIDNGASYTYVISRSNTASGLYTFDETSASVPFLAAMGQANTWTYHQGGNRIYGTLAGLDVVVSSAPTEMPTGVPTTVMPTAMPTVNPLAPGQTKAPTANPTTSAPTAEMMTTEEPGDSSKGMMRGIWIAFVIGVVSIMAIL